jgi:hypothetical protein
VGVAYNNGRVLSHEGNKVKISGVGRRVGGILIREGVRRNRLEKWRAASLNTGVNRSRGTVLDTNTTMKTKLPQPVFAISQVAN